MVEINNLIGSLDFIERKYQKSDLFLYLITYEKAQDLNSKPLKKALYYLAL